MKFKTIVLFSPKHQKTLDFKANLEGIKYIKLFQTSIVDEVQQLIDMSEQSVIIVDDEVQANKIFKGTLNKKLARFKKYYLNLYLTLPKVTQNTFMDQEYTVINSEEIETITERVELYFFGKTNIFSQHDSPPEKPAEKGSFLKKGFFTHLEKVGSDWRLLVSSHEADDEISERLGVNWDKHLQEILDATSDGMELKENRLETSNYQELVFPYFKNGKLSKLSIVHLSIDEDFAKNLIAIHSFLGNL